MRNSTGLRCRECLAKKKRLQRQADPAHHRSLLREWCKRNPDKVKISARKNYQKHKEKFKARARKWALENPKKRSRIMTFQNSKRRSRLKANGGEGYTAVQWKELLRRCYGLCVYCRRNAANSLDHFIPLKRGGAHDYRNIVPACRNCNSKKREKEPTTWIIESYGVERLHYVQSIMLEQQPTTLNAAETLTFVIAARDQQLKRA